MKLEICIDCVESAGAAVRGGADRLEVCAALACGGLTPSHALIQHCVQLPDIESAVMIRPHDGGFVYDREDVTLMVREIEFARRLGADVIVLGALTRDRRVDRTVTERLVAAARPLEVTFHRAFDLSDDPDADLDLLLDLGIDRLLTSGARPTAAEGAATIARMVARSGERLSVMAGAGITPDNVGRIIKETGVREIHASASQVIETSAEQQRFFGGPARRTSHKKVRAIRAAMAATK